MKKLVLILLMAVMSLVQFEAKPEVGWRVPVYGVGAVGSVALWTFAWKRELQGVPVKKVFSDLFSDPVQTAIDFPLTYAALVLTTGIVMTAAVDGGQAIYRHCYPTMPSIRQSETEQHNPEQPQPQDVSGTPSPPEIPTESENNTPNSLQLIQEIKEDEIALQEIFVGSTPSMEHCEKALVRLENASKMYRQTGIPSAEEMQAMDPAQRGRWEQNMAMIEESKRVFDWAAKELHASYGNFLRGGTLKKQLEDKHKEAQERLWNAIKLGSNADFVERMYCSLESMRYGSLVELLEELVP
jgi:hypothetical protein